MTLLMGKGPFSCLPSGFKPYVDTSMMRNAAYAGVARRTTDDNNSWVLAESPWSP